MSRAAAALDSFISPQSSGRGVGCLFPHFTEGDSQAWERAFGSPHCQAGSGRQPGLTPPVDPTSWLPWPGPTPERAGSSLRARGLAQFPPLPCCRCSAECHGSQPGARCQPRPASPLPGGARGRIHRQEQASAAGVQGYTCHADLLQVQRGVGAPSGPRDRAQHGWEQR